MGCLAPRPFETPAGQRLLVRSAIEADAAGILDCMQRILSDGTGVITRPAEFRVSLQEERTWIRNHAEGESWLALVALAEEEVCGLAHLEGRKRQMRAHTAELGLALAPAWRGQGLGRELMETVLAWARGKAGLERIELTVLADNTRAIHLYETLGFVQEGRRVRALRRADGTYVDDLQMALFV